MSYFDYLFKSMKLFENSSCIMTSVAVLFAYQIKLNISTWKRVTKILPKKLYCHFNLSLQCNKKNVGRNFVSETHCCSERKKYLKYLVTKLRLLLNFFNVTFLLRNMSFLYLIK